MLQIIYISTARGQIDQRLLDTILTTSRRNNTLAGVTGLLVASRRRFLQALEGPSDAVQATYQRIKEDPRHFALVELRRREIDASAFGSWAMACEMSSDDAGDGDLLSTVEAMTESVQDRTLRAHFNSFAEVHAR